MFGCRYTYKGTNFLANHNETSHYTKKCLDVVTPTKVLIFLQITTRMLYSLKLIQMSLHLQRY